MTETYKMRANAAFAAFTGLTLRLFFVLKFPMTNSGDGPFYIELAWNWLKYGVYGLSVNGHIIAGGHPHPATRRFSPRSSPSRETPRGP